MSRLNFIHLNKSEENTQDLIRYFHLLDNSFEPPLSSYVNIESYAEKLINNAYVCISKDSDNNFIGLFAVYINNNVDKIAYLSSIAVMDDYKGKGYARQILEYVINIAKSADMKTLRLEVKKSYPRAIRFYEKNGFIKSDEETDSTFYMIKKL